MKSIKPGRAPSMMGAFGSVAAAIFGIIWTISAVSMGAPGFFALFGLVFVALGIAQAVYNFKNATGKSRFSAFDITDSSEEPDPLNEYFAGRRDTESAADPTGNRDIDADEATAGNTGAVAFCPYCGAEAEPDYQFCAKCGKRLP